MPGGVRMAGRTFPDGRTDDARSASALLGIDLRVGLPGTFDSEADGMSGYVRRRDGGPRERRAREPRWVGDRGGQHLRLGRQGAARLGIRPARLLQGQAGRARRVRGRGHDPARSKADEILRRVEPSAKRQKTTKDEGHRADVARSLGLADVAPHGMTLEPGAGSRGEARRGALRKAESAARAAADQDAERRKSFSSRERSERTRTGRRACDVARRANAAEPRAAGAADAGPAGAIRRRRVRVSVPQPRRPGSPARRRGASGAERSLVASFREGRGKHANDARAEISSGAETCE